MRQITHLVVHCTATPQTATVAGILNYWRTQLGWKQPGYHIVIPPDGRAVRLLDDALVSNGVAGYNSRSLHVRSAASMPAAAARTRAPWPRKWSCCASSSAGKSSIRAPSSKATATFRA